MKRICLFIRLRVLRYFQDGYPEMDQKTWQQDDNLMSKWCPLKRYWDPIFIPTISISIRCIWGWLLKGPPSRGVFPHHFFLWPFHPPCLNVKSLPPLRCESLRFLKAGFVYLNDTHVLDIDENNWTVPSLAGQGTPACEVPWMSIKAYGPIIWLDVDGSEIWQTHQLRLVVEIPLFTGVFFTSQVVGNGISEPSTVWKVFQHKLSLRRKTQLYRISKQVYHSDHSIISWIGHLHSLHSRPPFMVETEGWMANRKSNLVPS